MNKTKNQSVQQFLDCLQKEYFICDVRRKIYHKIKDKEYHKRVMGFKRDKILDLSERFSLTSIFNSSELFEHYKSMIYSSDGLPNFDMTKEDLLNYFSVDSDVKVNEVGNLRIGKITEVDLENNLVSVKFKHESKSKLCSVTNVVRIL